MKGACFFLLSVVYVYGAFYSTLSSSVYGQLGSFTSNTPGVTADTINGARGVGFDSSETEMYIVDSNNNRVLVFYNDSTTAFRVYGQLGSFTTNIVNRGGLSADSLRFPSDVAISSISGALVISDTGNHRVLYYPKGSTTATRVYGQPNFISNLANQGLTNPTTNTLNRPAGMAFDGNDNLYIADFFNHRILFYLSGSTTATRVYGQGGLFTTNIQGVGIDSFYGPYAVSVSFLTGQIIVSDTGNHRVLFYPANGTVYPTRLLGQPDYNTRVSNFGGLSASSLNAPYHVVLDSIGGSLISDTGNHRVLYFLPDTDKALVVFGQNGSFTSGINNFGGVTQSSFSLPSGIAIARRKGILALADLGNNRALHFPIINTINVEQRVVFPNGGVVAPTSTLTVLGDLNVKGDMEIIQGGHLIVNDTIVNITAVLKIEPNSTLVVHSSSSANIVTVINYNQVVSKFETIVWNTPCSNPQAIYTLSALLLTADCQQKEITFPGTLPNTNATTVVVSMLSNEAIIGISIGCCVLGIAIAVAVAIFFRLKIRAFTTQTNKMLKEKELNDLRPNPMAVYSQ